MSSGQKTLVLGGSYFIGRRSVELLRDAGHELTLLNRGTRPMPEFEQLRADRNDAASLKRALAGRHFDQVIDFSCYEPQHAEYALAALEGRFRQWVYISSAAVYRDGGQVPLPESAAIGGQAAWGAYGKSKAEAEQVLRASPYSERITILRPPYLYGPGNNLDREQFLFRRLLRGRPVLVPGSGENVLQFLHIDDLGQALLALLRRPSISLGKSYNVGDPRATTATSWVRLAAQVAGVEARIISVPTGALGLATRAFFPMRDLTVFVDPHKLQLELGFRPRFELESGLAHTLESYDRTELARSPLACEAEDRLLAQLAS